MKEHVVRLTLDLFFTACYIFLVHTGYNITDQLSENKVGAAVYIPIWLLAAIIMFFLTKQRYDKEVEAGKEEANNE
jgi:hypothetical protein